MIRSTIKGKLKYHFDRQHAVSTSSPQSIAHFKENAASWGKEDAMDDVIAYAPERWGPEACALYNTAYKKAVLQHLILGDNNE